MLPLTVMEGLIAALPKSITMPNGDVIPVWVETALSIEEGVEQGDEDLEYPLIVLDDVGGTRDPMSPFSGLLWTDKTRTTTRQQTTMKTVGVTKYAFTVPDVVEGTTTITATVGGTPNITLTEGVDYELVTKTKSIGQALLRDAYTALNFLGVQDPDDGTNFTIDYETHQVGEAQGEQSRGVVQIHAHTITILNGDLEGAATKEHHREDVMRVLLSKLTQNTGFALSEKLSGIASVIERGNVGDFSHLEGRGVVRKGFDLTLGWTNYEMVDRDTIIITDITDVTGDPPVGSPSTFTTQSG